MEFENDGATPFLDAGKRAELLADRWGVRILGEMEGGHCSRVFDCGELVLKSPWQGEEQSSGWVAARAISGGAGPLVHQVDGASGSLLMDKVEPGTKLLDVHGLGVECFTIWCSLVEQLPLCSSDGLMTAVDYYTPSERLSRLLESSPEPRLLHGDLHHENILWGGGRWWAIDPKGLWGDPAWEAAAFLRNPFTIFHHLDDLAGWTGCRILETARFLRTDPRRVWAWAILDAESDEPEPGSPWASYLSALRSLSGEFGS